MSNRILGVSSLAGILLLSAAYPAMTQMGPPQATEQSKARSKQFQANVDDVVRSLDKDPKMKDLTPPQRKDLIEFVTGNMLFATLHELGHAHIQEMGLYVLGREEDAADSYAISTLLKVATDTSHGVLTQATKGWFLDDLRNQKEGIGLAFYDLLQLARTNLPNSVLQIHYRSAFRELIGYSNACFYGNNLSVPVRHPESTVKQARPIEVIQVNSIYQDQTNPGEAQRIVEVLVEMWKQPPMQRPSVGVVTFNRKQADLVEDALEQREPLRGAGA